MTKDGVKFATSGDIGSANVILRQNTAVDNVSLRKEGHGCCCVRKHDNMREYRREGGRCWHWGCWCCWRMFWGLMAVHIGAHW